jgi:hypothetical protein
MLRSPNLRGSLTTSVHLSNHSFLANGATFISCTIRIGGLHYRQGQAMQHKNKPIRKLAWNLPYRNDRRVTRSCPTATAPARTLKQPLFAHRRPLAPSTHFCSTASGSNSFSSGTHCAKPTAPSACPVIHLPLAMCTTGSAPRLSSTRGSLNCCVALALTQASSSRPAPSAATEIHSFGATTIGIMFGSFVPMSWQYLMLNVP